MKELSIEQKATAYEDLLKKAKQYYDTENDVIALHFLEELFPELKESEDERIRKEILQSIRDNMVVIHKDKCIAWLEKQEGCEYIKKDWLEHIKQSWYKEGFIDGKYSGETSKEWTINDAAIFKEIIDFLENGTAKLQHDLTKYANWLKIQFTPIEKQGKQFSVDKLEPKFKVGDWIILTAGELSATLQIVNVDTNKKLYWFNDNSYLPIVDEECLRLWTIQDAKDGDVLYSLDTYQPFIYKARNIHEQATAYCGINKYGKFFVWNTNDCIITLDKYIPAAKEQRDTLFAKMQKAGYEWNADKKELKKNKEPENFKNQIMSETADLIKGYVRQKPDEWGEEDENTIKVLMNIIRKSEIIDSIIYTDSLKEKLYDWLKSLKERVQPKQEWSEEDERRINRISDFIWKNRKGDTDEIHQQERDVNWLKSLRPQKPTGWSEEDEKMISRIRSVIEKYAFSQSAVDVNGDLCEKIYIDMDNWLKSLKQRIGWKPSDEQIEALGVVTDICSIPEKHYDELNKLYQDLKKLTE